MSLISTDLRPVGYDWVLYSRYTELYRDYTAVWKRFRILITENSFFSENRIFLDIEIDQFTFHDQSTYGWVSYQVETTSKFSHRRIVFWGNWFFFPTLIYIRDIEPMQNIFQINIFKNQLFWQWSLAAKLDWHGCQATQGLILGARTLKNQYHDFRKFFNRIRL